MLESTFGVGRRSWLVHNLNHLARSKYVDFPEGIGPVECVNVEHEEVVLIPQKVDAKKVNFKYGLGAQFITT